MNISFIDKDTLQEAYYTVTLQKWRSLMTMFGVFWGLFMLVVLLGCGFGISNGLIGNVVKLASNTIYVIPQETTLPYNGLDRDRSIKITDSDISDIIKLSGKRLAFITSVSLDNSQLVSNGERSVYPTVGGISPTYFKTIPQKMVYGRYINETDIGSKRKVCVVGLNVSKQLYGSEDPCGQHLTVAGMDYLIVGVVKQTNNQVNVGLPATESVLLPITTEQGAFGHNNEYDMIAVSYKEDYPIADYNDRIVKNVKQNHSIHPDDNNAVPTFNVGESIKGFSNLETGLDILLWIAGLGTLMAGLVGIANIMFVTIKERTQEIGVRRALGAEPGVIIRQVMLESLMLTFVAGIGGIVTGVWMLSAMNSAMSANDADLTFMENPMIPLPAALSALFILVSSGLLAGYFPARKAMKIKAIEALREE